MAALCTIDAGSLKSLLMDFGHTMKRLIDFAKRALAPRDNSVEVLKTLIFLLA